MADSDHLTGIVRRWLVRAGGLALLALPVFGAAAAAGSDEGRKAVETLVVTGMREQRLAELPRSASVVTDEDIALEPSVNIVDLLAREANLNLRSTTGNDKFSGVDIRGQGDTYTSNVVVMVDGIRLNAEDLSGADFSVVPPDQIERIEVVRGANTVRYGNGAVGGVINIITRRSEPGTELGVRVQSGSFATTDAGLDVGVASERWSAAAGGRYFDSDGYRDNSALEKRDLRGELGVSPVDWFTVAVYADIHRDEYGLPGPISAAAFNGADADRRQSLFPFDGGKTNDDRFRIDTSIGDAGTGVLRLVAFSRERENDYRLNASSATSAFDEIREDADRFDLQYEYRPLAFGQEHAVFLGAVADEVDYSRRSGDLGDPGSTIKRGSIRHRAWFAATDVAFSEAVKLSFGYRADGFRLAGEDTRIVDNLCDDVFLFGTPPNQVTLCNDPGGFRTGPMVERAARDSWRNDAVEAGLVYTTPSDTNWYVSWARSFRNPNVDELILADDDLGPQRGDHWDAGVRARWGDHLELSAAVFYVETKDEILFALDADTGNNIFVGRNFNAEELTERAGSEVSLRWSVSPLVMLTANVGYTRAEFKQSGARLPLVPEWTGSLGVRAYPTEWLTATFTWNYVGTRFDGNDFDNAGGKLDAYQVVDARFVYEHNNVSLFAGIANLFDEVYAASVYSNSFYPMPRRNIYAGISYRLQRS